MSAIIRYGYLHSHKLTEEDVEKLLERYGMGIAARINPKYVSDVNRLLAVKLKGFKSRFLDFLGINQENEIYNRLKKVVEDPKAFEKPLGFPESNIEIMYTFASMSDAERQITSLPIR
jgi:hypothetical protein